MISNPYVLAKRQGKRVAAHNRNLGTLCHEARTSSTSCSIAWASSRPRRLIEHRRQPLLGLLQILDRNENHE